MGADGDPSIYRQLHVSQGGRWYSWETNYFPISRREVETHSSNIHIVPANTGIAKALDKVKPDDLIEVNASDGWQWKSSPSREDTGPGACELLLLKKVSIKGR